MCIQIANAERAWRWKPPRASSSRLQLRSPRGNPVSFASATSRKGVPQITFTLAACSLTVRDNSSAHRRPALRKRTLPHGIIAAGLKSLHP